MDGHQVLKYLLYMASVNPSLSVFTISTFTFAIVTGILMCSNIDDVERMAMKHDMGSIASGLNSVQKQVKDLDAEQNEVREIITRIESKQDKLEESLYSDE